MKKTSRKRVIKAWAVVDERTFEPRYAGLNSKPMLAIYADEQLSDKFNLVVPCEIILKPKKKVRAKCQECVAESIKIIAETISAERNANLEKIVIQQEEIKHLKHLKSFIDNFFPNEHTDLFYEQQTKIKDLEEQVKYFRYEETEKIQKEHEQEMIMRKADENQ